MLIGAFAPAALRRVATFGDGFLCAAPLPLAEQLVGRVSRFWEELGRSGLPRIVGQVNVALGPPATVEQARRAIADYYAFLDDGVSRVLDAVRTDERQIRAAVEDYATLGFDELVLYCHGDDVDQVDRLADLLS